MFCYIGTKFDLSVYDIFGMLAEGGTIVLPRPKERKMADRWFDIVINEQIQYGTQFRQSTICS